MNETSIFFISMQTPLVHLKAKYYWVSRVVFTIIKNLLSKAFKKQLVRRCIDDC